MIVARPIQARRLLRLEFGIITDRDSHKKLWRSGCSMTEAPLVFADEILRES
jgi:hypothetical protein